MRSFERRIESLFLIKDELVRAQAINILRYNLMDNVNAYRMNEDGTYDPISNGQDSFDIHKAFYHLKPDDIKDVCVFE